MWSGALDSSVLLLSYSTTSLPYPITIILISTLKQLKRKHKFITYRICAEQNLIVVDTLGDKKGTFEEFCKSLPFTDCRCVCHLVLVISILYSILVIWNIARKFLEILAAKNALTIMFYNIAYIPSTNHKNYICTFKHLSINVL